MVNQPLCHKFVYKLTTKRLKQADWNLTLPLQEAVKNKNDVVALNDNQLLRWICELNGAENLEERVLNIKKEIKSVKKLPKSKEHSQKIKNLYKELYRLQYQKDYLCLIMDSCKDYDRANKGFTINGYSYHRLLGTNGGVKKSTITYLGDKVYKEIVKRMDNGRNKEKPLIPAKLEAYQALICSASVPVTMPRIVVVSDCYTSFREDVLKISDANEKEPMLSYEKNQKIDYCDSDGYGLMSPEYSRIVNKDLYGDLWEGQTLSGINTRYAWTKGMLFTFDFIEFAKRINHGNYKIQDVWGQWRDVRDYDVILTASMVKLWDSYQSLEDFLQCSMENHYQFSVAKAMPHSLEKTRNANYQFLQTYDLNDDELYRLCKPTLDEITDVLGGDWRKTIVFLKGTSLNDETAPASENDFVKALMIDPQLLGDPFILQKIRSLIKKRISMASKGSIRLEGNFATVSGDPYSLAQSIFGLPVTGLLKAGEVYHKYWIDKKVKEIALFRAPMTCHNNIRRRKVVHNPEMDFWYQYNTTGIILNSWDTTCDALNGADKDSDAFFTTNNPILVKNTRNSPTIECMQRKAPKIIPVEADLIEANKLSFGDEIGTTTNRITAMLERQAAYQKDSEEYRELSYRIKCGQYFQQNAIDKAKGILSQPMPKYWYDKAACQKLPENTQKEKIFKKLCLRIVADTKPYFMQYVYPDLMAKYKKYQKDTNSKCIREFNIPLADLIEKSDKTSQETDFIEYYEKLKPVGSRPCTVNRIAWLFEAAFQSYGKKHPPVKKFDASLLKSGAAYKKRDYLKIAELKAEYDEAVQYFKHQAGKYRLDKEEAALNRDMLLLKCRAACEEACPNEKELCDIVIDLCYSSSKSKQFAWDICGETIIENLLSKNGHKIHYPVSVPSEGEFEFGQECFIMRQTQLKKEESP